MKAARKSILLGLAALALLTSLSGCIVAERPGRYHGDWHQSHWNNGWQGGDGGGGGNWNHYR